MDGVNLQALFAPPTGAEIDTARARWSVPSPGVVLHREAIIDLGDRETVQVFAAFEPGGSDTLFVGAVRQPPRLPGDTRTRPAFVFLGDGPDADVGALAASLPLAPRLRGDFATIHLAYRGGTLTVGGRRFRSTVEANPYDADADDLLDFLDSVQAYPDQVETDFGCYVAAGHGRGGGVVLLANERAKARNAPAPSLVISLGAPTDFFLDSVQEAGRRYLRGLDPGPVPGIRGVFDQTVKPVRAGTLTPAEARLDLLARSPAYFAAPPPFIVAAHGERDSVVPIAHGRSLGGLFGDPEAVFFDLAEAGHASVLVDSEPQNVIRTVIESRVLGDASLCRS